MVVGPRYIPGKTEQADGTGDGKPATSGTDQVPDAARITPPRMPDETISTAQSSLLFNAQGLLLADSAR